MHTPSSPACTVLIAVAMQPECGCTWVLDLVTDIHITHVEGVTTGTTAADALAEGMLDLMSALAPTAPALAVVCNDRAIAEALHQRRNGLDRALRLVVAYDELSAFPLLAACTRRLVALLAPRTE